MPTICLATDEDLRAITSQNLHLLNELPHLYILASHLDWDVPREGDAPDVMRTWGIAKGHGDGSIFGYERLYPGAVVAPRNVGQRVSRADLLYHGAEPVADFTPRP
ncbi:MAG: hypothetical protein M3N82_02745 [Pseudomonadota bacterium]|nr:hypothetical protein [Pseudomonadota bacterium]